MSEWFQVNESTKVVQAPILNDSHDLRESPAWDATIAIDRAVFDHCRDDLDYSRPLDDPEVGQFLSSIDSQNDIIRD